MLNNFYPNKVQFIQFETRNLNYEEVGKTQMDCHGKLTFDLRKSNREFNKLLEK